MNNVTMLMNSIDKAMMENLKVYRNGGIGFEQNFIVINHENVDAYEIEVESGVVQNCTCGHYYFRKQICKHMLKVAMTHNLDIKQLKGM